MLHSSPYKISDLEKISPRLGSNPGGVYQHPYTKDKFYIKRYDNPEQAKAEQASSEIYSLMGIKNLHPLYVKEGGKHHIVTKWNDSLKPISESDLKNTDQLAKHLHAAVLTKNWDAVGLAHDNIMRSRTGDLYSVDLGGTLHFRVQGAPKNFDENINEYKSLRDPLFNPHSNEIFGHITDKHLKNTVSSLKPLTDSRIDDIISKFGFAKQQTLIDNLKRKRDAIYEKFAKE